MRSSLTVKHVSNIPFRNKCFQQLTVPSFVGLPENYSGFVTIQRDRTARFAVRRVAIDLWLEMDRIARLSEYDGGTDRADWRRHAVVTVIAAIGFDVEVAPRRIAGEQATAAKQ